MEKIRLAEALRARQRHLGGRPREAIDAQTDSEIINWYVTCSDCGGKMASEKEVEEFIEKAINMEEFLVFTLIDVLRHDHREGE